MSSLLLLLLALGIVAAIAGLIRQWWLNEQLRKGKIDALPEIVEGAEAGCCGQHEVCEKESLLAAVSEEIEYYEDEELDRFRGRTSDDYTQEEVEEFRYVLYTMRVDEVAGWVRSLQLRAVELPDELKDEVILIVGELRFDNIS